MGRRWTRVVLVGIMIIDVDKLPGLVQERQGPRCLDPGLLLAEVIFCIRQTRVLEVCDAGEGSIVCSALTREEQQSPWVCSMSKANVIASDAFNASFLASRTSRPRKLVNTGRHLEEGDVFTSVHRTSNALIDRQYDGIASEMRLDTRRDDGPLSTILAVEASLQQPINQ